MKTDTLKSYLNGFLHLFFPELCAACGRELPSPKHCFCFVCHTKLSPSNMHLQVENEFTNRFWGRLPLQTGAAMYYFTRKSPIQKALHRLKYQNLPHIGVKLGRLYGQKLQQSPHYSTLDAIVPVPLHPSKERLRGYNQSAMFCQGISEALGIPVYNKVLHRSARTETQTQKRRMERFENVAAVFALKNPDRIKNKHLLLVDDVLTTGATLETCGLALVEIEGVKISMAAIAIAL